MPDLPLSPQIIGGIAGAFAVLLAFYIGYRKKLKIGEGNEMGLNLSTDNKCPSCGTDLPTIRRPKTFRQMMWGGWTCDKCGTEFDKWLKPVQRK
jgi:predicted RNA-binding Zn-ribbon protein involved in translation (DUF1610 family)